MASVGGGKDPLHRRVQLNHCLNRLHDLWVKLDLPCVEVVLAHDVAGGPLIVYGDPNLHYFITPIVAKSMRTTVKNKNAPA